MMLIFLIIIALNYEFFNQHKQTTYSKYTTTRQACANR